LSSATVSACVAARTQRTFRPREAARRGGATRGYRGRPGRGHRPRLETRQRPHLSGPGAAHIMPTPGQTRRERPDSCVIKGAQADTVQADIRTRTATVGLRLAGAAGQAGRDDAATRATTGEAVKTIHEPARRWSGHRRLRDRVRKWALTKGTGTTLPIQNNSGAPTKPATMAPRRITNFANPDVIE